MKTKFNLANINICFVLLFCLFCVINNGWGQSLEGSDMPKWVVGDTWDVDAVYYSKGWGLAFSDPKMEQEKLKPHVFARYMVKIEVTAERKYGDIECWQLDFTPNEKDKIPRSISGQKYRILVSKEDGSIKEILCLSGENHRNPQLVDVNGITVLRNAPYGFPLEIISWGTNKITGVNKTILTATRNEAAVGNEKYKELIVRQGTNEVTHIKQKWAKNAKWWSEYEKLTAGHKDLDAKLIGKDSR